MCFRASKGRRIREAVLALEDIDHAARCHGLWNFSDAHCVSLLDALGDPASVQQAVLPTARRSANPVNEHERLCDNVPQATSFKRVTGLGRCREALERAGSPKIAPVAAAWPYIVA
jgi:hypothetical protein